MSLLRQDFVKLIQAELQQSSRLEQEFRELLMLEQQYVYNSKGLFQSALQNPYKNRYRDVLANEDTRVTLKDGTYINANYIHGNKMPLMQNVPQINYIATQGPLENTMKDFWTMILEQQCHIIVMLTDFEEKETIKCYPYFPNQKNQSMQINSRYFLHCTSCQTIHEQDGIVQYSLQIIDNTDQKEYPISLFQYKHWRDFGVPPVQPFLLLHQTILKEEEKYPQMGPICVHCSAGIGRSGTFITVDMGYKWLQLQHQQQKTLLIPRYFIRDVVHFLKKNRCGMVQKSSQYLFIYSVLCYYCKINI